MICIVLVDLDVQREYKPSQLMHQPTRHHSVYLLHHLYQLLLTMYSRGQSQYKDPVQGGLPQGRQRTDVRLGQVNSPGDYRKCSIPDETIVCQPVQHILHVSLVNARSVDNKLPELHDMIYNSESNIDCFLFY